MEFICNIKDAEVCLVVIHNQDTINEKGDIIPNKTVTHDLSFNIKKGKSVNQRVRGDEVPKVIFGRSILR